MPRLTSKATSWAAKFAALELQDSGTPPPHFYSTVQWAKRLNRSVPTAMRLINFAIRDGEAERLIVQVKSHGRTYPVPYYRIKGLQ